MARSPLHHDPVRHDSSFEVAADESKHAAIHDSLGQPSHQHIVVDAVEKLLEVNVHHPPPSFLDVSLRLAQGVVSAASRPKAVAVPREGRVNEIRPPCPKAKWPRFDGVDPRSRAAVIPRRERLQKMKNPEN
jgi:hypothetical protein